MDITSKRYKSECDKRPKLVDTCTLTGSNMITFKHSERKRERQGKRFKSINECVHLKVFHAFRWWGDDGHWFDIKCKQNAPMFEFWFSWPSLEIRCVIINEWI